MSYFLRVIRISFKYRWSLLASVVNALLIGILWSVTIAAVYPVLEVVFRGNTFDDWASAQIAQREESLANLESQIAEIKSRQGSGGLSLTDASELKHARRLWSEDSTSLHRYREFQARISPLLPQTPFGTLVVTMGWLLGLTVIKGICITAQAVLVARVAEGTAMDLRRTFYRSILHMDQIRVDQHGASQLMTQLSHNISLVSAGLKDLYGQSIREPLKMLACVVGAAFISWQLLLLSMVVTPLGIFALRAMSYRVKNIARGHMGGVAAILQTLMETINGLKVVKIFNREQTEAKRFKSNARSLYVLSLRMNFYDSLLNPITEVIGIVAVTIAILCGGWLVLNQETHLFGLRISDRPLSASALFLFFGFMAGISGPARKLSSIYNALVRACMSSERLYNMFDLPPTLVAASPAVRVPIHQKSIRFEKVCFAYRVMHRVVHNVSFEIPFGQTVALVGHNGCGKTTLVHLIARFYDPVVGEIYLDGIRLRDLNPRILRRQFSMVSQESYLFDGTIEENIAYGTRDPQPAKIREAARIAMVDQFASGLPEGWQTRIGDNGKRLSGGQRQRVAIARALVGDPRILILDEATSQIDPATEKSLHENLRTFLKNRTVFMITHRSSTLDLADRVLVVEAGRVVEDLRGDEYRKRLAADKDDVASKSTHKPAIAA